MTDYSENRKLATKYFPEGCPLCAGEVLYHMEDFVYRCKECDAYVSAHRKQTRFSEQHEPEGDIADKDTNLLRKHVHKQLAPLYLTRMQLQNGDKKFVSSPINGIFPKYCVEVINEDGPPKFGYVVSKTEENYFRLAIFGSEQVVTTTPEIVRQISNRTKTYLWLSMAMDMPIDKCKIKKMSKQELLKASKVIAEAVENIKDLR